MSVDPTYPHQLLQALIERSTSEERTLLERVSDHVGAGGRQNIPSLFND
ncbi:MAG: hypothetical protein L6461_24010 [Anaerolineae bacterium]|nr:hypothetical protein [Anaerolineae bacterium]